VCDGGGHAISNLTIADGSYLGLFGYLGAEAMVRNLGILDAKITGSGSYIGALVGSNGGPWDFGGDISNCYSTDAVSGGAYSIGTGGLVGYSYYHSSIISCYSSGSVSSTGCNVGGLVGWNHGRIAKCYSTGLVSGDRRVGGLVGEGDEETVVRSFWDIQASGQTTSAGGTGLLTSQMQTAKTFLDAGWDFVGETANGTDDIWWILAEVLHPQIFQENPISIGVLRVSCVLRESLGAIARGRL
jgi:hypothetical protein